ncbi:kinase-like protein [Lichtheimia hyalospora FSU 10163]|nr:kinase-like protein [Lichtheimia hyalospora FSU 10163]
MLTRNSNNNNTTPEWVEQSTKFTHIAHSNGALIEQEETKNLEESAQLQFHSISTEHRYMRSSNSSSSSGGFGSSSSNSTSSSPQPNQGRIMEPGEFDDLVDDQHCLSSDGEHDAGSSSDSTESLSTTTRAAKRRKRIPLTCRSNPPKRSARKKPSKSKPTNKHDICVPPITLSIDPEDLKLKRILGEGQMGMVMLAEYQSVPVACKFRRAKKNKQTFEDAISRELAFAARLSVCPYMNPCIGILRCKQTRAGRLVQGDDLYIVQRYYENGDLRDYMEKLQDDYFHETQVLQMALSLFAGLADAHKLNIGILDLKLENILIDSCGSAWITDFGSCVELRGDDDWIDLRYVGVQWTKAVAAPEMLHQHSFSKKSDVFMAASIIAEALTPQLSDEEFAENVLARAKNGTVNFNPKKIHPMYRQFVPILKHALVNDPDDRPSAQQIYKCLLEMRHLSMKEGVRQRIAK